MTTPNANTPDKGLLGQAQASVQNAANYVTETIAGKGKEASAEANLQTAKGNTGGTLGDRAQGAINYAGDKLDQAKHEGSAEANKQGI